MSVLPKLWVASFLTNAIIIMFILAWVLLYIEDCKWLLRKIVHTGIKHAEANTFELMPWMFLIWGEHKLNIVAFELMIWWALVSSYTFYYFYVLWSLDSVLFRLMHNLLLFKTKGFQSRNCLKLVCLHFAEWVLEYLSSLHSKHIYSLVIVTHSNHDPIDPLKGVSF